MNRQRRGIAPWAAAAALALQATPAAAAARALVVSGLGGDPQFEQRFADWAAQIARATETVTGDPAAVRQLSGADARAENVQQALRALAAELRAGDPLIVVLIGHGSHDGREYRLNLPGPDLTGTEFAALLDRLPATAPQLVINATSASGAVAERWQRPHRVVITATRSAAERNATRFAGFWAEALAGDAADRDKDGAVTVLEAYEFATRRVAESFKADAALVTEHATLGGGDAARFVVARRGGAALHASDPQLVELRAQQVGIEIRLAEVKGRKAALPVDDYYERLEPVLLDLARLGQRIDARLAQLGGVAAGVDR